METLKTLIEFVGSKDIPGGDVPPVPGGDVIPGSGGSQIFDNGLFSSVATGDNLIWITLISIFLIALIAVMICFIIKKQILSNNIGRDVTKTNSIKINKKLLIVFVLIVGFVSVFFLANVQSAMAKSNVCVPEKLKANIDDKTNTINIEKGFIVNTNPENQMDFCAINIVSNIDVGDYKWTVKINDQLIYDAKVNNKNTFDNPIKISDKKQIITLETNMSVKDAKKLIGNNCINIQYDVKQSKVSNITGIVKLPNEKIEEGTAAFYSSDTGEKIISSEIRPDGTYSLDVEIGTKGYIRYTAKNFVPFYTQDFILDKPLVLNQDAQLSCNLKGSIINPDSEPVKDVIVEMKLGEYKPDMPEYRTETKEDGSFVLQVPRQTNILGDLRIFDPNEKCICPLYQLDNFSSTEKNLNIKTYFMAKNPVVHVEIDYSGNEEIGVDYNKDMFDISGDPASAVEINEYTTVLTPKDKYAWPILYMEESVIKHSSEFSWSIVPASAKVSTKPFPNRELKYTGDNLEIAKEGTALNGTIMYFVSDSIVVPEGAEWKTTIDEKSNVGTYYLHFYAKGNEGFRDSAKDFVIVTIYQKLLNDYEWSELKTIADEMSSGKDYPEILAMARDGQTKTTKLTDGDILEYRIVDINNDVKEDGSKAGLTFMAANVINKGYCAGDKGNSESTLASWWGDSPLRKSMQEGGDIYKLMPKDLTDQVTTVVKSSKEGWKNNNEFSDEIKTSKDKFFLASGYELGTDLFGKEGNRYQYAKNDPWQLYWSSFSTGPSDNTLNHTGFLYLKEHQTEISSPMDAHTQAYNHGGVVRVPGHPDQDIEYEYFCWLRSPYSDNPHDQGCLYYSGSVHNVGWVNYEATVAPCFCL